MDLTLIPGFDKYLIDDTGIVYSLYKGNELLVPLHYKTDKDGYKLVNLSRNKKIYTKKVHRLVAQTFIPNPNNYPEVNHKDGDKANNRVENLEWVTHQQNIVHSYKYGLRKKHTGKYNKSSRVVFQIKDSVIINVFDSITEASAKTLVSVPSICRCCKGKFKHAGGYQWKYKD